ncbi:MAG: hypothetical protein KAS64_05550 [Spirochaetes bacterium]|nr:hypothetical protein [Spirochaetota bacterium]
MRRIKYLYSFSISIIFAIIMFASLGCSENNPLSNDNQTNITVFNLTNTNNYTTNTNATNSIPTNIGYGSLIINYTLSLSRTIVPNVNMDVDHIDIIATGPYNSCITLTNIRTSYAIINNMLEGPWIIKSSAFNPDGINIAYSSNTTAINLNLTTSLNTTMYPLEGQGTLYFTFSWTNDFANPNVTGTLTPAGDSPQSISFTIDNKTASYSNASLDANYYTLSIVLKDDIIPMWGTAQVVRILAGQITEAHLTNVVSEPIINITNNQISIALSGVIDPFTQGQNMTVIAAPSEPVQSYQWYLDSLSLSGETNQSVTIGSNLSPGVHRIDVLVTSTNNQLYSTNAIFTVVE